MIPTKSFKFKDQVMYEQKFQALLSSKFQVSPERRVLDLESEVQGFNTRTHNIFTGFFSFHVVNPVMPILLLLPTLCIMEKLDYTTTFLTIKCIRKVVK